FLAFSVVCFRRCSPGSKPDLPSESIPPLRRQRALILTAQCEGKARITRSRSDDTNGFPNGVARNFLHHRAALRAQYRMNSRPVIFISAVSRELRSTRDVVAKTLLTLGYEPKWQDIAPTETGDL